MDFLASLSAEFGTIKRKLIDLKNIICTLMKYGQILYGHRITRNIIVPFGSQWMIPNIMTTLYKIEFDLLHCLCDHVLWFHVLQISRLMTKPTKWHVRPAKTQTSLGIRPVWSESSLPAQWVAKDPSFLHAHRKSPPSLIWVFAGHTSFCWFCHEAA